MTIYQVNDALKTTPAVVYVTSLETRALEFDVAALLGAGETPSQPTTRLVDLTTGEIAGLPKSPTLAANVITQVVSGLTRGHIYELVWGFSISANEKPTRITIIEVPA